MAPAAHLALLLLLCLCLCLCLSIAAAPLPLPHVSSDAFPNHTYIDRTSFPPHFVFGVLTLAVKHEGAASLDGKVDSIWDSYARKDGIVLDGTFPGATGDEYNRYMEDVQLVASMGMDAYRFSIAWTRIFPNGTGEVPNSDAIAHYNNLIDDLKENGVEPHVTLWSEDHPQALEDLYGGLLSPLFIEDFVTYANVCFAAFGDRVKYWITFDEPNDYASLAYASTQSPPGRCTPGVNLHGNCTQGNGSTEPYLVGHNILLAHAAAAKLYKEDYQTDQGGYIGIALWFKWYEPLNDTNSSDIAAAQRAQAFFFGWFMDPLIFGQYPDIMREMLGPRLPPPFTDEEATSLRQSLDFVGINIVTASYVTNSSYAQDTYDGYFEDMRIEVTAYRDDVAIGEGESEYSVPWCLTKSLAYMRERYQNPTIYITEMGWGISTSPSLEENLNDTDRIQFFHSYYTTLSEAIRDGADVRGVFAWSLIDGFEFFLGLSIRFGLFYVDEKMERYPKLSASWHKMVLSNNKSDIVGVGAQQPSNKGLHEM